MKTMRALGALALLLAVVTATATAGSRSSGFKAAATLKPAGTVRLVAQLRLADHRRELRHRGVVLRRQRHALASTDPRSKSPASAGLFSY